ncbi:hypothetical protein DXG03_005269 [Asterophora parasitica]|uniref:Mitochondrial outer membrane protein IML2 n=1 Tax=Asterophora parasitica TaxID=117018 RepID=A0A9P7K8R4_9AGAR|nr:hypothetical protein DXG03_005269 [Asterophora parasitica]
MADSAPQLRSATRGFDYLFTNDLASAKAHFASSGDDPFHQLGQGVCAFMEAALGMETGLMTEASRLLALSEAGARRQIKSSSSSSSAFSSLTSAFSSSAAAASPPTSGRFPPGLEWEILNADAVVLLGLTNALSESYMGYLQCMYALNSAHGKFSKLYKSVFPNGLPEPDEEKANGRKPTLKGRTPSSLSLRTPITTATTPAPAPKGFLARLTGGTASAAASTLSIPGTNVHVHGDQTAGEDGAEGREGGEGAEGPVEDLIIAGTAFGFGLFNLVFSLLPKKVQSVVGFLGFKHDRKLALRALALAAGRADVHGVFAGIESRYPSGTLWILNRAKIMRMAYDPEGAIQVLRSGLASDGVRVSGDAEDGSAGEEREKVERGPSFRQADTLLVFELAWTLLGQRRYQEAADMFIKVTELNTWSHGTYYFLAAGCYISLGNTPKAQALLDAVPDLIDKKKITGKDLPTEVFIKKKLAFYQEKQRRRGGDPALWAETIKISVAEELGIFWNTHARISHPLAIAHIREWSALTPVLPPSEALPPPAPLSPLPSLNAAAAGGRPPRPAYGFSHALLPMPPTPTPAASKSAHLDSSSSSAVPTAITINLTTPNPSPSNLEDLDTPDEFAIRYLLVGICERTAGAYAASRASLKAACDLQGMVRVSTWVGGVAMFELAVLDLKELQGMEEEESMFGSGVGKGHGRNVHGAMKRLTEWDRVLKGAGKKLDAAMALAGNAVDLSSRLDSRVSMLRDEIAAKREALGI